MLAKKSKVTEEANQPKNITLKSSSEIVIDESKSMIFQSEEELYDFFKNDIQKIEQYVKERFLNDDFSEAEFEKFENHLEKTLDAPDEIWELDHLLKDHSIFVYIRYFENEGQLPQEIEDYYYLAMTLMTDNLPSFIFYHWPSKKLEHVQSFREEKLVYSRALEEVPIGAVEGDSLWESDELAIGLYSAMMQLRAEEDIPEIEFQNYAQYREETIESSDEIWRNTDSLGNVLVTFIAEYTETDLGNFYYLAVTVEDGGVDSHALLFSFPTKDASLVGRYRHGENLQAEEVIQESSH